MAADATAELEVLIQIKAAIENLGALKTEAKKAADATKEIESASKSFASTATSAFGALKTAAVAAIGVLAARSVVGFFEESIDAAAKEEQALNALTTQLALTGESSAAAIQNFKDLAEQIQANTKFDSDLVISQLAVAKSFGISNESAEKLIKAAVELAAATGTDLESAVQQLGKTFAGVTGKLDEQIPSLKNLTKAQLAAGEALDQVLERFGGAAAAEVETFAGAITRLENTFGDLQKAIGRAIVDNPVLVASINEITRALGLATGEVESADSALKEFVNSSIYALLASLTVATDVIGTFVGGLRLINSTANAVAGGVLTITSYIDDLNNAMRGFLGSTEETVKPSEDLAVALNKVQLEADDALAAIQDGAADARAGIDGIAERITDAAGRAKTASNELVNQSKVRKVALKEEQKAAEDLAKATLKAIEDERKAQEKLDADFRALRDKARADAQKRQEKEIADAAKAAKEARGAIEAIAANPITFFIETSSGNLADDIAAISAGIISKALDGAAGAKALISDAAAAFANQILPGIGPVVGSIVSKLAEGPDATKKFVREFVAAIPDIVEAIGEAAPAFVEAFVDSMVNEGGALRIGIAIAKAMAGEGIAKSIGKQIGLEFGSAFNSSNIAQTLRGAFDYGRQQLAQFPVVFNQAITRFQNAGKELGTTLSNAIKDLPGNIKTAFTEATTNLSGSIKTGLTEAITGIAGAISEGFKNLALPTIPTPGWLQSFIDAANKISGGPGGGGGVIDDSVPVLGALLTSGSGAGTEDVPSVGGDVAILDILGRILTELRKDRTIETSVEFNSKTLADIMLNLSRRGARTAA